MINYMVRFAENTLKSQNLNETVWRQEIKFQVSKDGFFFIATLQLKICIDKNLMCVYLPLL